MFRGPLRRQFERHPNNLFIPTLPCDCITFDLLGTSTTPVIAAGSNEPTFVRDCVAYKEVVTGSAVTYSQVDANVARISQFIDASSVVRTGIHLEPERENACTYSTAFASWSTDGLARASASVANPMGATCTKLTASAGAAGKEIYIAWTGTVATNILWMIVTKGDGNCRYVYLKFRDDSTAVGCWVDLNTGTIANTIGSPTAFIRSLGVHGSSWTWYLVGVIKTFSTGGATYLEVQADDDASGEPPSFSGGDGSTPSFYLTHVQQEIGNFPTTPIITAGSAATRLADALSYDAGDNVANTKQGALKYMCVMRNHAYGAENLLRINDGGAATDQIGLTLTANDYVQLDTDEAETSESGTVTGTVDTATNAIHAIDATWKPGQIAMWQNGAYVGRDTPADMPDSLDTITIDPLGGIVTRLIIASEPERIP